MEIIKCRICENALTTELTGIKDWEFGTGGTYDYMKCKSCGIRQIHPFPSLEILMEAYPDNYTAYASEQNDRGRAYKVLKAVNDIILRKNLRKQIHPKSKVLDIGCGNGELLSSLRALGAKHLDGIDFSPRSVSIARSKNINVFQGLFEEFQSPENYYDIIFMMNYIEHVFNPYRELKKAYDLLTTNGCLIGELPNFDSFDRMIFSKFWGGNHVPRHTFQFGPTALKLALQKAGFRDIRIYQGVNPGHIVISIQNWLQRNVVDLKNNSNLRWGRMRYFSLLLILLLPINIISAILNRSGVMRFKAIK